MKKFHLSNFDFVGFRIILYFFEVYLVYSDCEVWRSKTKSSELALTSIIAFEPEFNRTVNEWQFNRLRIEARSFNQASFNSVTKAFTLNINALQIFYVDAGMIMAITVSASIILIALYTRLGKKLKITRLNSELLVTLRNVWSRFASLQWESVLKSSALSLRPTASARSFQKPLRAQTSSDQSKKFYDFAFFLP